MSESNFFPEREHQYNLTSNSMKTDDVQNILIRTAKDIYRTMVKVYGPYTSPIFFRDSDGLKFTKDGKNILSNYSTNNHISNIVIQTILDAIKRQERLCGDGTTTVSLVYSKLIEETVKTLSNKRINRTIFKRELNILINNILEALKPYIVMVDEKSPEFYSMIYTATQNIDFTRDIIKILEQASTDTVVNVKYNPFREDIEISNDIRGTIRGKYITHVGNSDSAKKITDAIFVPFQGILTLEKIETIYLLAFLSRIVLDKDIVFLVSGLHSKTIDTLIKYNNIDKKSTVTEANEKIGLGVEINKLDERCIHFFSVENYNNYDKEELLDFYLMTSDVEDVGGTFNPMSFESVLNRTILGYIGMTPETTRDNPDMSIVKSYLDSIVFDMPTAAILTMNGIYDSSFNIEINTSNILITNNLERPNHLKNIDGIKYKKKTSSSLFELKKLDKRLTRLQGKMMTVEVGSGLTKDAIQKADAWEDAVKSAQQALDSGIIKGNGLLKVLRTISEDDVFQNITHYKTELFSIYTNSFFKPFIDLLLTRYNGTDIGNKLLNVIPSDITMLPRIGDMGINLNSIDSYIEKDFYTDTTRDPSPIEILNELLFSYRDNPAINENLTINVNGEIININTNPIESFSVIKHIVEYSYTAVDIGLVELGLLPEVSIIIPKLDNRR